MRILVVEDETELREAIVRRLRAEGHAVDSAVSGEEATRSIAVHGHAVVVLDRMLQDGDSLKYLGLWRKRGWKMPILILTSRGEVRDRIDGLAAGGDDYLAKPFAMAELLARIDAIARRQPLSIPPSFRIGSIEIDFGKREVRRGGVLLPLRPKEYALLELLAQRTGRVVSREEITRACWDGAHEPNSNVEEVLVASLRRKLGRPSPIRTSRGVGYRLVTSEDDHAER